MASGLWAGFSDESLATAGSTTISANSDSRRGPGLSPHIRVCAFNRGPWVCGLLESNSSEYTTAGSQTFAQVHAPAIDMEGAVTAVETNNLIVAIFHPDGAFEAGHLPILAGIHLEEQAAYLAQKLAAQVVQFVILAVKAGAIDKDHGGEAHGAEGIELRKRTRHAFDQALVEIELLLRLLKLNAPEEVVVLGGEESHGRVGLHALEVGFYHRAVAAHGGAQGSFVGDNSVDRLIGIGFRSACECRSGGQQDNHCEKGAPRHCSPPCRSTSSEATGLSATSGPGPHQGGGKGSRRERDRISPKGCGWGPTSAKHGRKDRLLRPCIKPHSRKGKGPKRQFPST